MKAKERIVFETLKKIESVINEATANDESGFVKENLSGFMDRVKMRMEGFVSDCYDADAQRGLADDIINDIDKHVKEYKCLPEAIAVKVWHNELAKETTEVILINDDKEDEDCDYIYRTSSKEEIRELCNRLNHFTDWYITDYCGMY